MVVQAQNSTQYFSGPIISGTILPISEFAFIDNSHVSAKIRGEDTNWVYGTDYTISGAGTSVRTITILKAVAADEILAAFLDIPITQGVSPEEGGNFPAAVQEMSLDKLTYICQVLNSLIENSLRIDLSYNIDTLLTDLTDRRCIIYDATLNKFVFSTFDPDTVEKETDIVYIGYKDVAGSYKIEKNSPDLVFSRLESGIWVEKARVTA